MTYEPHHNPNYKPLDEVPKYKYHIIKEILIMSKDNLIVNKNKSWTEMDIEKYHAFIMALYLTGGRISEVLSIKISDVQISEDKEWLEIYIPTKKLRNSEKGNRQIPIYIKDEEYKFAIVPFCSYYNKMVDLSDSNEEKLFTFTRQQGYCACIKCGFNPHFLRKIFITHKATRDNMNTPMLQKLSGHRSMNNLLPYIAMNTSDIKEYLKKGKE